MVKLLQSNFAGGEASKRLYASGDLDRYGSMAARVQNALVLPLGALERRSGTIWAADPKDVTRNGRLLSFVRAVDDAVAVVVQHNVLRFIDVAARTYLLDGGNPLELACSWSDADYPHLFTWQSADVLWIGDRRGTAPVKVLKRVAGVWQALTTFVTQQGPFLPDPGGVSLTFDGLNGAVNVSASANIFTAGHDGALLLVRENTGAPPIKRWTAAEADVLDDELRFNGGRVYEAQGGGKTGNNSPIHDEGVVSDGGVSWLFVHDGAGVAQITGVTDGDTATASVLVRLPKSGGAPMTTPYWAFSAFSNAAGFPRAAIVHHERMVLGGAFASPDTTYMSRVANYGPDYADFKSGLGTGLVVDSDAVTISLATDTVQSVRHYVSFERLYVFTDEGVHLLSGPSLDEPITPAGRSARERCSYGAAKEVAPIKLGDSIAFVTSGRMEVREIVRDSYDTPSMSVLVDHIAGRRFAELAFAKSPFPVLWSRLDDGKLASMTYERLERVRAWAQHEIGGGARVTSAIALPRPDGRHELWCYLARVINGATRYSIEVLPPAWNPHIDALEYACAVDAAGFFDFWNTNGANRARLTVLNMDERAGRIETELNTFSAGDVGKRIALRLSEPNPGWDGGDAAAITSMDVTAYIDAKTVEGTIAAEGAVNLPGVWTKLWARMATSLSVGARLEGATLSALADGSVQTDLVVAAGNVVLSEPAVRGWIGLPHRFELIDLPIAQGGYGVAYGGVKKIEKAWIIADGAPPGVTIFNPEVKDDVGVELVLRDIADATDRPPQAVTGFISVIPKACWSDAGQIGIRLDAPYPFVLLGIVKELD